MDLPKIAGKAPVKHVATKDKKYAWCTCGLSESQPLCNGAHKGSEYAPKICVENEDKEVYLCACKQTSNPPYCDGSHNKL